MLVMDAITEILKREGISTMFCFPTTPIIEAAVAGGMRPVICRQERVGVHMADGCARVTNGKPAGVFAMQYGPGAENAFAGIASAYSDSTPILLIPLGHPRETAQMWPLFNSTRTYASVTKHVEPVMLPEHTVPAMRRAFNALKNGRPGPVMVEVPADVMTAEFAGNDVDYTAIRPTRSAGDARDIDDAAKMLLEAQVADHHRRPGRALRRGQRRAARARRTARHPGHDDDRRQERLSRGPRAGAGVGRRRLYRARPPVPARQRRDLRDRHQPHAAQHLDPDHPAGKEDHPRDQRRARPLQGERHRDPDPRRRQARAGAARPRR